MQKLINFLSLAFSLSLAITLVSCGDDEEEIVEVLSMEVNGETVSFSNPNAGEDLLLSTLVVTGTDGENHQVTIGVLNTNTGTFTQEDISEEVGAFESNYTLYYYDANGNSYYYDSFEENANFSITVDEFSSEEGGLVSGSFEGVLFGSFGNGDAAADSVIISDGIFTVKRSDATLENPF